MLRQILKLTAPQQLQLVTDLADIAVQLGWSEGKVKEYSALKKVGGSAWEVIAGSINSPTAEVGTPTFTVALLRPLLKLTEAQQLQLVTDLANGTINKNKFKALAEKYKAQNEDIETLKKELGGKVSLSRRWMLTLFPSFSIGRLTLV